MWGEIIYNENDLRIAISEEDKCVIVNDISVPFQLLRIFENTDSDIYHQIINNGEDGSINISVLHKRAILKKFVMELLEINEDEYINWLLKSRGEVLGGKK